MTDAAVATMSATERAGGRPPPRRRALSGTVLSAAVTLPVLLFIALPIVAMLAASFRVEAPSSSSALMNATRAALHRLGPDPGPTLTEWWEAADEPDRVEAFSAAFQSEGLSPPWNRSATYAVQAAAVQAALGAQPAGTRRAIEAAAPLAHASLDKRAVIAARLRDVMPAAELAAFRAGRETRWGLDNYRTLIETPRLREAARNTFALATVSATLVTAIGFGLALGVHRRILPGGEAVRALLLAPLVSPPVILAMATLLLFGRQGLVTKTLLDDGLGLIDASIINIYGVGGVIVAQTLGFIGPVFIVISAALARRDADLEDAAAALGASWWGTFRAVTLPMAWPGIARAFLLAFVLSLTDFGNPVVIGQNLKVLAAEIYGAIMASRDYPLAAALCVWLLLPAAILYAIVELAARRRRFTVRIAGHIAGDSAPAPIAVRAGLGALAVVVVGAIALLFATVVACAFVRQWGIDYTPTFAHILGHRADGAFAGTGFGTGALGIGIVASSLKMAAIAAALGGLFAVVTAYVLHRVRPPGAGLLGFLVLMPAVLPGLIFGLGYVVAFNNPFGMPSLALTGTLAILVLNVLFGNLFVGVLAARAALAQLDAGIEEAAESLGANLAQRLVGVVLPALLPAFLLGGLYIFVDSMTTFSSVIFLVSGRWELASVEIFNQAGGAEVGAAAAKTVAILAVVVVVVVAMRVAERGQFGRHKDSGRRSAGAD